LFQKNLEPSLAKLLSSEFPAHQNEKDCKQQTANSMYCTVDVGLRNINEYLFLFF